MSGRHREAVERELAKAPPMSAEQGRAYRELLLGYAVKAREDRLLAESRRREETA